MGDHYKLRHICIPLLAASQNVNRTLLLLQLQFLWANLTILVSCSKSLCHEQEMHIHCNCDYTINLCIAIPEYACIQQGSP